MKNQSHIPVKTVGSESPVSRQYKVILKESDDSSSCSIVSFLLDLQVIDDTDSFTELLISRADFLMNEQAPAFQFDKCLDYSGRCLYPLQVIKNNNDGRLFKISNAHHIRSRWQKMKKWMLINFEGEAVNKLAEMMDNTVADDQNIATAIKNNLFYQLFFFPLYNTHPTAGIVELQHSFSIIPNSPPVTFLCERAIEGNEYGNYRINVKGKCTDSRSYNDIVYSKIGATEHIINEFPCKGTVQIDYNLDACDMIGSISGYMEISTGENDFTKIEISISHREGERPTAESFKPFAIPEL